MKTYRFVADKYRIECFVRDTPGSVTICEIMPDKKGVVVVPIMAHGRAVLHPKETSNHRTAIITSLKRALEYARFQSTIPAIDRRFIWHEIRRQLWEERQPKPEPEHKNWREQLGVKPPEPELKPCPWCGSDDLQYVRDGVWWLQCKNCQAKGPESIGEVTARIQWNTRHG